MGYVLSFLTNMYWNAHVHTFTTIYNNIHVFIYINIAQKLENALSIEMRNVPKLTLYIQLSLSFCNLWQNFQKFFLAFTKLNGVYIIICSTCLLTKLKMPSDDLQVYYFLSLFCGFKPLAVCWIMVIKNHISRIYV